MGQTLLLRHGGERRSVIALAAVGDQHAREVVPDYLPHFLVAVPRADLVDRLAVALEGHQEGSRAANPPAGVVGMHPRRVRDCLPQGRVRLAHRPRDAALRILHQPTFGHAGAGQEREDGGDLAERHPRRLVQHVARGQQPLTDPVRRRPVLVRRQRRMPAAHRLPARLAAADRHAELPHPRVRLLR
jgi:hypothetical protein